MEITQDIMPVPFTQVSLEDSFWKQRIETNRMVTIPVAFSKCEETGRIGNFALAGGVIKGQHKGDYPFDDTDVYKVIEGASYTLAVKWDDALDKYLDSLIMLIAAAQEDDGYIYTCRTNQCERLNRWMGSERWEKLNSHELYNCGHLYEAAVAHYQATDKRSLLDIAILNANLVCDVFGPGEKQKKCPSGHPIIEMALVKLYHITGDKRYLDEAMFFINETGVGTDGHELSMYSQDHKPIREQDEAVGHAVRFGYLFAGVADVAGLTQDSALFDACQKVWNNVADKKLYITGGIGARGMGEGFGRNYELPNMTAYCETCASIAYIYFNYRMFLLTGDARYYDVLERTLYNSLLSGVSLSGDRFFYDNVLETNGYHNREPWFGCACCPGNVTRFMASVPGYVYAASDEAIYINLYAQGDAEIHLNDLRVQLGQETKYPWDGRVFISVAPERKAKFTLSLRIPGWALNTPAPSELYHFLDSGNEQVIISVNDKPFPVKMTKGYIAITRVWQVSDHIEIIFPMPVRRIFACDSVTNDTGKVVLQRGPIVYCLEGKDNGDGYLFDLFLHDDASVISFYDSTLLNGVILLQAQGKRLIAENGIIRTKEAMLTFIPYNVWNNRGQSEMITWIPRNAGVAIPAPEPTIASGSIPSASTEWAPGLNDQFEPSSSEDTDRLFFYWWLRFGSDEWVQYDFERPYTISETNVYWLNFDHYDQILRVPADWRLLYRKGNQWLPFENLDIYGVEPDQYNKVRFTPVTTSAVRLEAKLQEHCSGGIMEWEIH